MKKNWKIVKIPEVLFFQEGPGVRKNQFSTSGVKLLNVGNINEGRINLSKTKIYISEEEAFGKYKHFLIDEGDLVIASSGIVVDNFYNKIAFIEKEHLPLCMNTSTIRFKALDEKVLNLHYFKFFLKTKFFSNQLQKLITGSAQLNFGPSHLKKIDLILPPIEDQKRIVKILDAADALRQKRKQAITLLDDYLKSVFLEMFGDPMLNPKKIKKAKIKDIGQVFTGNTPPRNEAKNYGSFIEWIKSDNINNSGHYLTKASEFLSESGSKKARIVPSGSILVTCIAGSISCIGNAGITDREVAFNQQINAIVPNSDVDQRFLYSQILFNKELFQKASTNSMKGMLNKSKFSEIELLKPDFILQKKYANFFLKTESIKQKMLIQLQELEICFQALMQKAFKGEL